MKEKFRTAFFSRKTGKIEYFVILFYILGICLVSYFHEPWFDDVQAWNIAKSASLREILFHVPHYEGHPQLWHLLLAVFAKQNAPFRIVLIAVNLIFNTTAVSLLVFRSPFPKFLRCLIPFTYFIFYQYGVNTRPYCITFLAFLLMAMTYQHRNEKPFRYVLSMCLLCCSTAFGIIFSGGLCLVWTGEILKEYLSEKKWNTLLKDKRLYSLLLILILAVFLILSIIPAEDVYYIGKDSIWENLWGNFIFLFMIPANSLYSNYICETEDNTYTTAGNILEIAGGLAVWAVLILIAQKNKKLWTFLVPYCLFSGFCVLKYFSAHHLGISTQFLIFLFWIILDSPDGFQIPEIFVRIWQKIQSPLVVRSGILIGGLLCLLPVWQNLENCYLEICYPDSPVKVAEFIKENHLEDKKLMYDWTVVSSKSDDDENQAVFDETLPAKNVPEIEKSYPFLGGVGSICSPYFDKNIFMNFNAENPSLTYMQYKTGEKNHEAEQEYKLWHDKGLPDFIFGTAMLNLVYSPEELEGVTYYWIDNADYFTIFKGHKTESKLNIYIRGDLLDQYPQFTVKKYATILTKPIEEN